MTSKSSSSYILLAVVVSFSLNVNMVPNCNYDQTPSVYQYLLLYREIINSPLNSKKFVVVHSIPFEEKKKIQRTYDVVNLCHISKLWILHEIIIMYE